LVVTRHPPHDVGIEQLLDAFGVVVVVQVRLRLVQGMEE